MRFVGAFLLLAATAAFAQTPTPELKIPPVKYPTPPKKAATPEKFAPKGWLVEAKATGDLNGDGLLDAALVLHQNNPKNWVSPPWAPTTRFNSNPRMLVVLFGAAKGYDLALANHVLIPRVENANQEQPFDGIKIENGLLKLKMHLFFDAGGYRVGRWGFAFRWQGNGFKLVNFDRDSVIKKTGDTEVISIDYQAGRKDVTTGNLSKNKENKKRYGLPNKDLVDLTQMGDGLQFKPDEH
jgi:hypothetical protein